MERQIVILTCCLVVLYKIIQWTRVRERWGRGNMSSSGRRRTTRLDWWVTLPLRKWTNGRGTVLFWFYWYTFLIEFDIILRWHRRSPFVMVRLLVLEIWVPLILTPLSLMFTGSLLTPLPFVVVKIKVDNQGSRYIRSDFVYVLLYYQ